MFSAKEDFPSVRIHLEENVFLQSWNTTQCKGYKLHNRNEMQGKKCKSANIVLCKSWSTLLKCKECKLHCGAKILSSSADASVLNLPTRDHSAKQDPFIILFLFEAIGGTS